jgi:hypothetical protein
MLNDVERRAFLVQPTRKDPLPIGVGATHIELDEGARQPLGFPRRGRFASAQADHRILGADRLPWPEHEIAHDSVALVEQCDHRHALAHRRHARGIDRPRKRFGGHLVLGHRLLRRTIAGGHRQADRGEQKDRLAAHPWSGVQAL